MRKTNAEFLSSHLSKYEQIEVPEAKAGSDHIFQMYTIKLKNKVLRDELHDFLIQKRIFSKIYFSPIHLTKFYVQKYQTYRGMLPITEDISDRVLTLPMYPHMTDEEKNLIVNSIHEFFENK